MNRLIMDRTPRSAQRTTAPPTRRRAWMRALAEASTTNPKPGATWGKRLSRWFHAAAETLRRAEDHAEDHDRALSELATIIEDARDFKEVEEALLRVAREVSDAERVELFRDEIPRLRRVAYRPRPADLAADDEGDHAATEPTEVVRLPLRFAGQVCGTLRLDPAPGRRFSPRVVRRLGTLCTLAAAAEHDLGGAGQPGPGDDPNTPLRDSTFLGAILPYALGQAKRHREALTLLSVSVDRLAAIRQLHGPEFVDRAVHRVAEAISSLLRSSDVVARLEDDRIIVLLPNAGGNDAVRVAEKVRQGIEEAGAPSRHLPKLTASIGVATYPGHAQDVPSVIAAAEEAMGRAERLGRNRVVAAPPLSNGGTLGVAHCAG